MQIEQSETSQGIEAGPACGHSACSQNYIETGENECVKAAVSVTLHLIIDDPKEFAAAALTRAIEDGIDPEDAAATYTEDQLTNCARMLFDPGKSPKGCSILDSSAEESPL